jgi:hypothetical protein
MVVFGNGRVFVVSCPALEAIFQLLWNVQNANETEWVAPAFFQSRSPRWFLARWCDKHSVQGISPESDELAPLASGNNDFSFEHV